MLSRNSKISQSANDLVYAAAMDSTDRLSDSIDEGAHCFFRLGPVEGIVHWLMNDDQFGKFPERIRLTPVQNLKVLSRSVGLFEIVAGVFC